jgi:hypothetical protein
MRPPGRRLRTMALTVSTLQHVFLVIFFILQFSILFFILRREGRGRGGGGGEDQFGMCSRTSIARIVPKTHSRKSVP